MFGLVMKFKYLPKSAHVRPCAEFKYLPKSEHVASSDIDEKGSSYRVVSTSYCRVVVFVVVFY